MLVAAGALAYWSPVLDARAISTAEGAHRLTAQRPAARAGALAVAPLTGADRITTLAGNGKHGNAGNGGPATATPIDFPSGVTADRQGNVYISDALRNLVWKVSACGTITRYAGTGQVGRSGDGGPALAATLNQPRELATDSAGNLYIADTKHPAVRKVTPQGVISTAVPRHAAPGIAVDERDNLYVLGDGILRVTPAGERTQIVTFGSRGPDRDGQPAAEADISSDVRSLGLDRQGNFYFTEIDDGHYSLVRKVDGQGRLYTVAGSHHGGDSMRKTVPAKSASLPGSADGIAVAADGTVYFSWEQDSAVYRVRGGLLSWLTGVKYAPGFLPHPPLGDGGPARRARLHHPEGIALDTEGNLLIADTINSRVRKVWARSTSAPRPLIAAEPNQSPLAQGGRILVGVTCSQSCSLDGRASLRIGDTVIALGSARAQLGSGTCQRVLAFRIPPSQLGRVGELLRSGIPANVSVTVRATGTGGQVGTARRTITARP